MNGNVYVVMAVVTEDKKKGEKQPLSKIVMQPKTIIAKDDQAAATKTLLTEVSLREHDADRLEVIVRPF